MKLILASLSPRRKELLLQAGLSFHCIAPQFSEGEDRSLSPKKLCLFYAQQKAISVLKNYPGCVILSADTVVALGKRAFGKPKDAADAAAQLAALSGRTHHVHTGVSIISRYRTVSFVETTKVEFYPLSTRQIHRYIETGEPFDKAGSYGIQGRGAVLIKRIEGDYYNVMGLPLARVVRELPAFRDD